MMEQEHFSAEVRRWALEQTKKHVAYLKYIKSRGYAVHEEALAGFEEEIRVEEENLGDSELDVISEQSVAELQRQLALVDLYSEPTSNHLKALLFRLGHTKLRMRAEKNHQRPHFHIDFKREYSASYAVDTLQRIAGYMPKKYEAPILEWAAKRRRSLAATWEGLNNGEDIREMLIVAEEG